MTDNNEQLNFDKETLTPPKEVPQTNESTSLSINLTQQTNILPSALETSAASSIELRNVQARLANFLMDENLLYSIAADKPEVLPNLLDSINNAVSSADNLLIKTAQVAEKNASMNKVLEYLTKKQEQEQETQKIETQKDEWYDESVEKIKKAIYRKLDNERDAHPLTSADFIDDDIIEGDIVDDENDDDNEDTDADS